MKYAVIGGAGNVSKPLSEKLLKAGNQVKVVGRNAEHLASLVKSGAEAAIGSVEDVQFLRKTFADVDAVYTMVPPNYGITENWKDYIGQIGNKYVEALKGSPVKWVVNLSSIGAHLPEGAGPVSGLYKEEHALNSLTGINIRHLRPSFFYQNLLANVPLIKHAGIMGGNFSIPGDRFPIVHPADISDVAAEELLRHDFKGNSYRYIASDETSTDAIAASIGKAIGKPELPWVRFPDSDAVKGMQDAGFTNEIASNYVEMGNAFESGRMTEDYWQNRPTTLGRVKLDDFAKEFAMIYNASA